MLSKGVLHTVQHGGSERIVGIDHANLLVSKGLPHSVDLFFGFVCISRTHVNYPMAERRVERLCTGEKSNERNLVGFSERNIFHARRSADEKAHRKNALILQMFEAVLRFCRIVTVVRGDQTKLASMHSALLVYGIKVRFCAGNSLRAQKLGWTFQRGAGADGDFFIRDTRSLCRKRRGEKRQQENAE